MVNPDSEFSSYDGRCLLTRRWVAELLNEGVAEYGRFHKSVAHFSPDDVRLTDEVCVSFCNNMADFADFLEATENVLNEYGSLLAGTL